MAQLNMDLTQAATEGQTAAQLSAAVISATGEGGGGATTEVLVQRRSTLGLELPAGADPQSHLATVEASVCSDKPAGCTVRIVSGRRRQLQSTQVTFQIDIPVGAADSLSSNATASAELTSALTSSVAQALGQSVSIHRLVVSARVTVTLVIEGSASEAQSVTSTSLSSASVTSSLAASLGVSESTVTVAEAVVVFPPRPPPTSPPPSPPPPSPPPCPPPPPLAPGSVVKTIVTTTITVSGDVASFDQTAFKTQILAMASDTRFKADAPCAKLSTHLCHIACPIDSPHVRSSQQQRTSLSQSPQAAQRS